jgi:restriction system protein
MIINELVKKVSEISSGVDYWFVRTDYGKYFETFYNNGFIAIGWNEVTLEELKSGNLNEQLRSKIINIEKLDPSKSTTKGRVTTTINKLNNFVNLKKGDVIIIPSRNSSRYAFGVVSSGKVIIDNNKTNDCDFYKRKEVNWITIKNINDLDPNFYRMRITQHTISKVGDYSDYIDNVIKKLYIKNDNTHFVLDIKTQKDINLTSLVSLIDNIQLLVNEINSSFNLDEQIEKSSIRLNLQSPGQIEFKVPVGKSLITLATILSLTCCNNEHQEIKSVELNNFVNTHIDTIEKINNSMNELEVDKEKINSFTYGNR